MEKFNDLDGNCFDYLIKKVSDLNIIPNNKKKELLTSNSKF